MHIKISNNNNNTYKEEKNLKWNILKPTMTQSNGIDLVCCLYFSFCRLNIFKYFYLLDWKYSENQVGRVLLSSLHMSATSVRQRVRQRVGDARAFKRSASSECGNSQRSQMFVQVLVQAEREQRVRQEARIVEQDSQSHLQDSFGQRE